MFNNTGISFSTSGDIRRAKLRKAYTLVEVMIAVTLISLLMGPIFMVYRSGSKTSLEGLVKGEITLEAMRIIRQIHDDLKYSVFFIDYNAKPLQIDKTVAYFSKIIFGNFESSYSILRFPLHGNMNEIIENTPGTAYRKVVTVTYELSKSGTDSPFYTLSRKEGALGKTVLSNRVNFFEIRENPLSPAKTTWLVTLQIAEAVKRIESDINVRKIEETKDNSVKAIERRLLERTQVVQIADFYDVVASEYYSIFKRSTFIPNWQTLIKKP
ncbi:MAG: prepilin-type N-terminal cleavage/methylation domain-containing protein [Candidatus Riflebacteria bacterium]|nr:prepilin-type N-terminal cleavage/methylation domain-containing protein [Candidatus Riflebacteria bacterium]